MLKGSRAEFRSTARQPRRRADHLDAAGLARQPMVTRALRVRPCWLNRRNRSLPTDPWRRGPLDRSPSRFYLQWAISHSSLYMVLPRSERAPQRARGEPSGEAFGWLRIKPNPWWADRLAVAAQPKASCAMCLPVEAGRSVGAGRRSVARNSLPEAAAPSGRPLSTAPMVRPLAAADLIASYCHRGGNGGTATAWWRWG
jgi:hypothetical protein